MKFNIMGFYQPKAVELGLDSNDLLVLRWFVDYAGTNKMRTMILDNKIYYWVNYNSVLEELPILKITKQTLARKHFGNLVKAEVLEHKFIKEGGSFSYYCYGINYDTLVYLQTDGGYVKNNEGMSKNTQGCVENYIGGMSKQTDQINNTLNNNSIIYNIEKIHKKEKFIPPTLEQVKQYAKSRGREDLARKFFEYYTADENNLWTDKNGVKLRSWKQKFLTWCGRDNLGIKVENIIKDDKSMLHSRKYDNEEFANLIDDIKDIEI